MRHSLEYRLWFLSGLVMGAVAVGMVWVKRAAEPGRRADLLARVKERGVIRVGVKADAPPFGWQDEFGRYGFDVDMASALAEELGIPEVEFVTVTSADRFDKVVSGEVDMAIASMTITRSRDERVDFTIPYFQDGQALLVKADSSIQSYDDLAGRTVGAVSGTTSVDNIKQAQPDCTVKEYPGYDEAMAALASGDPPRGGEVDAITSDMLILLGLKLGAFGAKDPDAFRIAGERFSTEPYGVALAENQSDLRDALNDAIQRLWETGRWQRIFESWFGERAKYRADVPFVIVPFPR